ncbi:MAG: FAD-dependent oxidoreductase [Nanoarchaeota archaeon]|nr:FAD-dependent oxidoreductase [Nanoarchaeota archaeon]
MKSWDVIVVGGGIAGLSAAMYAGRFMLKTLVITKERLGLLATTHTVENYPGFKKIVGAELVKKVEDHAVASGAEIIDGEAVEIKKSGEGFAVKTTKNEVFHAKAIIITTGTKHRELDVPGVKKLFGKGVSYCATCDGPLYRNKIVGVVGGSDSAAKEALMLSQFAKKVFIIYRKEKIRAEPVIMKRVEKNEKVEVINNANVVRINGKDFLKSVTLDREYNDSKDLKLDGLFIEIGSVPLAGLVKPLGVKLNVKGEIIIDKSSRTSVKGVFAAGDCCNTGWKQAIIGAGEGAHAAFSAYEYIQNLK